MNTVNPAAYEGDIVSRLRNWRGLHLAHGGNLFEEAANEIERLRNGAVESCETVQDGGVVPTVAWFDQKIAEECRIAQAEIARLREAIRRLADQDATLSVQGGNVTVTLDATLTDEERKAIEIVASVFPSETITATLRSLLARLS